MAETATTNTSTTTAEGTAMQQNTAAENATGSNAAQQESYTSEQVEKMLRSAEDRVRNQMGNENKKLRGELEAERKKNLSANEIKDLELKEREKTLAERDKTLTEKENRWIAMKAIKEAGLDDGSDAALAIVDFVMAEDETAIKERVKAFDGLVKRIVEAQVKAVFKANGRTPGVGSDTAAAAGGANESAAALMGRKTAAAKQASKSIRDHFIGGK